MALDAIAVRALCAHLNETIKDSKIDKIHQPEKDEITIYLRNRNGNSRLLISASPANARVHFLNAPKSNPMVAPNFCMLLRKHLTGGKITNVIQHRFERIIDICIECYTELGDLTEKHLICEIMGRHSNIILADFEYKVLDSIKHIDFYTSSVRQILPGLKYEPVPPQDKINPLTATDEEIKDAFFSNEEDIVLSKFIMSFFDGFSPINAREISFSVFGDDIKLRFMSNSDKEKLICAIRLYFDKIKNNDFSPCVVSDKIKPIDFSCFEILQYGNTAEVMPCGNISDAISRFYLERDSAERKKQKSASLIKTVTNNIERCAKKINLLNKTLNDAKNRDEHKMFGDLINANLYNISAGAKYVEVINFYTEDMSTIRIPLDSSISPQSNAQKFYKKYAKAKVAAIEAKKQADLAQSELEYLESVLSALCLAEDESDLNALRDELEAGGYVAKKGNPNKRKQTVKSYPLHFISSEGFDIYVGKNNIQNDTLTLKTANSSDLWFHTKNFAGSHTIIKFGVDKNASERTIFEAATLAATYSSAKNSSNVPVDYTTVKNVKKPNGAKPGMVIYDNYRTLYVDPDEKLAEKLICKK